MKKSMILLLCLCTLKFSLLHGDNDLPIPFGKLPLTAQQFIKSHFPNGQVSFVKVEQDFMETRYEVMLAGGIEVEFLKNGSWREVSCMTGAVPTAIIPTQIMAKLGELYPDGLIVEIDRDRYDYEVKLAGGLELAFDLKFNLIDIDN